MIRFLSLSTLALTALVGGELCAQSLRGSLTTPQGVPVPGAQFTLLDASSQPVGTTVTDPRGEFWFDTGTGGRFALRVERIGQRTFTGEPLRSILRRR